MNFKLLSVLILCLFGELIIAQDGYDGVDPDQIQPYTENPRYWQYQGKPVLLLGASDDDNIYQWDEDRLISHLDSLVDIGGNYLRNTMSDRDAGNLRAFARLSDGKYDLSKWNTEFWAHFRRFLELTQDRDIVVQIELWDRFDHSRSEWKLDPYNPANNVNYTYEESGFEEEYPEHPARNKQPFFFTVPALNDNKAVLPYQEGFISKILSISLDFDHILYCMDNETSGVEEWGRYWAEFIKEIAGSKGKQIMVTEMWDNWDVSSDVHKQTLDHPELYNFVDISQNSQTTGFPNYSNAQKVMEYIADSPRPVNSTKIYGSSEVRDYWEKRGITEEHAVQSFCRNIISGFASSRFHRPPGGLGLSAPSMAAIKTIREIEKRVHFWELEPSMDLLEDNEENEAYASARPGEDYVLYFPAGGEVSLDVDGDSSDYRIRWISIDSGEWGKMKKLKKDKIVTTPDQNGWWAVIMRK